MPSNYRRHVGRPQIPSGLLPISVFILLEQKHFQVEQEGKTLF